MSISNTFESCTWHEECSSRQAGRDFSVGFFRIDGLLLLPGLVEIETGTAEASLVHLVNGYLVHLVTTK